MAEAALDLYTRARLQRVIGWCDGVMLVVGFLMIAYVGIGVAGFMSPGFYRGMNPLAACSVFLQADA